MFDHGGDFILIQCPECELQVSDKALSCPHCGYPLKSDTKKQSSRRAPKRMRLPNGFGQISEIKGHNLRNPFRVMISTGKKPNGRPICELLKPKAYFKTYNEAYQALLNHHSNPYDLNQDMLMKELYERWSARHFEKLKSRNTISAYESAWKYISPIHNMRVADIKTPNLKNCIQNAKIRVKGETHVASPAIQANIKILLNLMFDMALEYEIVDRNKARSFALELETNNEPENGHIAFTDDEMNILWQHVDDMPYVDMIIIQCYSGWRPQELCSIKLKDVDIEKWTFKGGMKTTSGTDRVVPIHSRIRQLVAKHYEDERLFGGDYLFSCDDGYKTTNGRAMTYSKYSRRFENIVKALGLNPKHRPHDPRVQFVTMAKKYKVDDYVIKRFVGHQISDLTERVYTKRDFEWMRAEMEKIESEDINQEPEHENLSESVV